LFQLLTTGVEHLSEFSKKIEMTMLFSGAWEKMIHEKNLKQKSRDTGSLIHVTTQRGKPALFLRITFKKNIYLFLHK
jgi:hypothetical protein